jgi:hypothetical protein
MRSSNPAARGHGRNKGFLLLSAVVSLISLHSQPALSASLAVTIRQLNPDSAIQQVTCAEKQKCLLPIDIETKQGKKETLTALILFAPGRALFQFQTTDGFLYAWDKKPGDENAVYETIWHELTPAKKPLTGNVTLFLPAVSRAVGAPILNVAHEAAQKVDHQPVADLEITVAAAP